jgi:branched-chain amino acid transport system permease protein
MAEFVIAGLVMGGVYAISASGLVVTYVSTGVMNFAFGALAFMIARLYYFLHVTHGWSIPVAAVVAIPIAGGLIGVISYFLLFQFLARADQLVQIASTIGLAVAIPPAVAVIFGSPVIETTPGLAPQPVHVFHLVGVAITMDQLISYICVVVILAAGTLILRYTSVGLTMRALVDSPALASLQGVDSRRVGASVWALCVALAGLAGVLAGPILGLSDPNNYTLLIAAAFAAVVAGKLRRVSVAVATGFAMGVTGALLQWGLPPSSRWAAAALPSVPFVFIVLFLIGFRLRGERVGQDYVNAGGVLDEAIHVELQSVGGHSRIGPNAIGPATRLGRIGRTSGSLVSRNVILIVAAILPFVLSGYRVSLVAEAAAYGVALLSYTLLTGEGGMIWLCQITFAGIGALGGAHLVSVDGWPLLLAIPVVAAGAAAIGAVLGALTLRMGELYVALVTLTFGLLMSNIVFSQPVFVNGGVGVPMVPPSWIHGARAFDYFCLAVFVVCALVVWSIRRSTLGMVLAAQRATVMGTQSIGGRVVGARIATASIAAAIAAVGGVLIALYSALAEPTYYQALTGLAWIAVIVTIGVRSCNAALLAGLGFVFIPNLVTTYLTGKWDNLPTIAFGVGAVLVAKDPQGVFSAQARQLRRLFRWALGRSQRSSDQSDPERPVAAMERVLVGE